MKPFTRMLILCAGLAAGRGYASEGATEYELKAAYLFNALRFIEWFAAAREDLTIGIVDPSPIEGYLHALESSPIKGRRLHILSTSRTGCNGCCHVLFFSKSRGSDLAKLLAKVHSAGVLTVGDDGEFVRAGGMMALVTEGRRLTIAINAELARQHGFTISSQLLGIAKVFKGSGVE